MSESSTLQSFEELNRFFREKLGDDHLYRGKKYSFLKIFQHALSYDKMGAHNRAIGNYMHWPLWAHAGLLRLKSVLRKPFHAPKLGEIVCVDPARIVADEFGAWHSIYMERIASLYPQHSVTMLNRKSEPRLANRIELDKTPRNYTAPDAIELSMLSEIQRVVRRTQLSNQWTISQKKQILSALHIFFDDFRFYYALFRSQPTKAVLFISHYHNEGLIAALEVLGIKSIELQHGLIAGNDLYYQYSDVFRNGVKDAFFPDNIFVYGSYWKNILLKGCEFSESDIVEAGDYLWQPEQNKEEIQKSNIVLICAQKGFHSDYLNYAKSLKPWMDKHHDWKWVIKMHPLEKRKSEYYTLSNFGFEVVDQEQSLNTLLCSARIHISIYSTTFYDALGYDVVNFSLQDYGTASDYARALTKEGVALPLRIDEDPIEKMLSGQLPALPLKRSNVYAPFDTQAIQNAIGCDIN